MTEKCKWCVEVTYLMGFRPRYVTYSSCSVAKVDCKGLKKDKESCPLFSAGFQAKRRKSAKEKEE